MKMKIKYVELSDRYLVDFFKEGKEFHYKILEGCPSDTELVSIEYPERNFSGSLLFIKVYLRRESFEDIPEGGEIPRLDVVMRNLYIGDDESE